MIHDSCDRWTDVWTNGAMVIGSRFTAWNPKNELKLTIVRKNHENMHFISSEKFIKKIFLLGGKY